MKNRVENVGYGSDFVANLWRKNVVKTALERQNESFVIRNETNDCSMNGAKSLHLHSEFSLTDLTPN